MRISGGIMIRKDDPAGAAAVRKPSENRREYHPNPYPELMTLGKLLGREIHDEARLTP
jgi:hypothetical protein